jgi:lipopolysaccharide/colanic/teichoic acid biosynthesis glycosyltransferase
MLAVCMPILLLSLILILVASPGNPIYTQRRVGKKGQVFKIFKLRTMTINPLREIRQTRGSDPEILWVGKILRRLKIDELPQLFNVLSGEMSLVGPRPCLEATYNTMPKWAMERFLAKPGLTGLAQVNGNIELSWEQRWHYDNEYMKEITLYGDLKILMKTFLIIFWGEAKFRREI